VFAPIQTDSGNHIIRSIALSSRLVSTLAGRQGVSTFSDGTGTTATFNFPSGVDINAAGTVAVVVSRVCADCLRAVLEGVQFLYYLPASVVSYTPTSACVLLPRV
jgi:hypothetical protein